MLSRKVSLQQIDYKDLENALRERFPELDRWEIRKPRYLGEEKYHQMDNNGNLHIRHEWSIIAEEEWNNDSSDTLDVPLWEEEDDDETQKWSGAYYWKKYREGRLHNAPIEYLLSILAKEGKLEVGKLLVNISW